MHIAIELKVIKYIEQIIKNVDALRIMDLIIYSSLEYDSITSMRPSTLLQVDIIINIIIIS